LFDTFMVANEVGFITDQLEPTPPFARLKSSSTGVVGPPPPPPPPLVTTAVGLDVADALPPAFVAVTVTSIVEPASAETSVYVVLFVPIGAQFAPLVSQRSHW
jgi:hypothetical protein